MKIEFFKKKLLLQDLCSKIGRLFLDLLNEASPPMLVPL